MPRYDGDFDSIRSGWIPKWLKGPDCKSGGIAFAGSNPAPPMGQAGGIGEPAQHQEALSEPMDVALRSRLDQVRRQAGVTQW